MYVRHRDKTLRHETIRVALAKGQQLPPELLSDPQGSGARRSDVSYGVLLLFGSAGVSAFLWSIHNRNWAVGLVGVALGVGYLVSHAVASRGNARRST